ncbi:MAG TPA: glutathione peroxidase [Flavobacterium sp.]|nr:glutathione peroxidase [Flavobacterium sp.]
MKHVLFLVACLTITFGVNAQKLNTGKKKPAMSLHTFKVTDINGETFDMASLRGKKVMIVNTASECGFTPQYAKLEKLYQKYKSRNFVIIGFPSNDFAGQEPGSDAQIKSFCQKNYGVTFPLMSKVVVKGKSMIPLYQFLTQESQNGVADSEVAWNFQKYLIDENGALVKVLEPNVAPDDASVINWLEGRS